MKIRWALAAMLLVSACGGNPWVEDDGSGDGDDGDVPAEIAKDLRAVTYSPANGGKLTVDIDGLVGSGQEVTFLRAAALDVGDYEAYRYQENGLQRSYLALVSQNARKNLQVVGVSDGSQFNRNFGGANYTRLDVYKAPDVSGGGDAGQFSYAGTYAGIFATGNATNPALPSGLSANSTYRVEGDMVMTANFANSLVEGGVDNRWLLDSKGNAIDFNEDGEIDDEDKLPAIAFPEMEITEDGTFLGKVEIGTGSPQAGSEIGNVGGLFGGNGATDVAGAIVINPLGQDSETEIGIFNLPRCGTQGDSPICDNR